MKNVFFIRHANSPITSNFISDHDRSISNDGITEATKMAEVLFSNRLFPDHYISSTAKRALETCQIFKKNLTPKNIIDTSKSIYYNGMEGILSTIKNVDNKYLSIAIVGHNPTMHNIVNLISNNSIDNFKTSSVLCTSFNLNKWSDFDLDLVQNYNLYIR